MQTVSATSDSEYGAKAGDTPGFEKRGEVALQRFWVMQHLPEKLVIGNQFFLDQLHNQADISYLKRELRIHGKTFAWCPPDSVLVEDSYRVLSTVGDAELAPRSISKVQVELWHKCDENLWAVWLICKVAQGIP